MQAPVGNTVAARMASNISKQMFSSRMRLTADVKNLSSDFERHSCDLQLVTFILPGSKFY